MNCVLIANIVATPFPDASDEADKGQRQTQPRVVARLPSDDSSDGADRPAKIKADQELLKKVWSATLDAAKNASSNYVKDLLTELQDVSNIDDAFANNEELQDLQYDAWMAAWRAAWIAASEAASEATQEEYLIVITLNEAVDKASREVVPHCCYWEKAYLPSAN